MFRGRGVAGPVGRGAVMLGLWGAVALVPAAMAGQDIGWTVAGTAMIDPSFSLQTPVGAGLTAEIEARRQRDLSVAGIVTLARTDFSFGPGPDEGHRNHGMAAVAARWMRESDSPSVGGLLGVGAIFWDDVNETQPELFSSADGAGLLLVGLEVRVPAWADYGLTISARDAISGIVNGIFDPAERDIEHRVFLSVGVYRR